MCVCVCVAVCVCRIITVAFEAFHFSVCLSVLFAINTVCLFVCPGDAATADDSIASAAPDDEVDNTAYDASTSDYSITDAARDDEDATTSDNLTDDDDDSITNNDEWECPPFVWNPAAGELPVLYPFRGPCGFNVDVTGFSPTQFYELFLSPELIRHFVVQTNIFADQFIQSHQLTPHSRVRRWVETDEEEMKKFLGLVLLMGIIHKPNVLVYGRFVCNTSFLCCYVPK